jgi:hypothetical protein
MVILSSSTSLLPLYTDTREYNAWESRNHKKKQNLFSYRTEKKEANDKEINEYVHAEYFLSYN